MVVKGRAAAALEDVQAKHTTIVQIERCIAEVHALMIEVAQVRARAADPLSMLSCAPPLIQWAVAAVAG
jgi:hypothetical protein